MKPTREKLEAARAELSLAVEAFTAAKFSVADKHVMNCRALILQAEREDEEFEAQLRKLIEVKP